jgi:hypothetical protein
MLTRIADLPARVNLEAASGMTCCIGIIWTPALRIEYEAFIVVRWLQHKGQPRLEWLDAIKADRTISEPVRERALQFARERKQ